MLHHSEKLAEALADVGVPAELIVVAGGGHSTELFAEGASPDLESLTQSLLAFLEDYLK
jgi:acetyl esterase/lipase